MDTVWKVLASQSELDSTSRSRDSLFAELLDTREDLALEELERGTTTGRAVADALLGAVLGNNGGRVTTTDDDGRAVLLRLETRVKHRLGATGEVVKLKHTSRAVPEDSLGLEDGLTEELARLLTSVKTHPAVRDTLGVGGLADSSVLVKLVSGDVVNREDELDVVLLGLGNKVGNLLGALLVEERGTDLDVVKSLLESEGHATADDERVDLVKHVVNELNLVGNLGTTEDGKERPLGALESLSEELELLLHEVASSTLGELNTDHGGVGTVGGTESVVDVDVTELGERGAELLDLLRVGLNLLAGLVGALALLLNVVAEVLEEEDLAVLGISNSLLGFGANGVGKELNVLAEQLGDLSSNRLERVLGNGLAVGSAHVGHEDYGLGLLLDSVLDGGEGSDDSLVVGDPVAIHGDVEVHTDEDLLASEVDIGDSELARERHCGSDECRLGATE